VDAYLRNRDISTFNCGERPPMNEAKKALISASKSEPDHMADLVASRWPVDVIYLCDFRHLVDFHESNNRYLAHVLERAGIKRLSLIRTENGAREVAYSIRNHERSWTPQEIRTENDRLGHDEKCAALYADKPTPPLCHRVIDVNGPIKRIQPD